MAPATSKLRTYEKDSALINTIKTFTRHKASHLFSLRFQFMK
jgi:hypothetical protein